MTQTLEMERKLEDRDLYEILELDMASSTADIKKAYRKKALSCHPDKNPDNPNAAALFHELSRILEILTDGAARGAYDRVLKARKAAAIRHRELDGRRKKLKEDLEARERSAESRSRETKTDAEKLSAEIERLRREGSKAVAEEEEYVKRQVELERRAPPGDAADDWDGAKYRIKIKWKSDKNDAADGGYDEETLRRFLSKYGDIVALVVSPKKSGSALVEFATREAAEMAVELEKGSMENPLTLRWIDGPPPSRSSAKAHVAPHLARDTDFESLVLRKMRQAEERKRLIAQMMAEEND